MTIDEGIKRELTLAEQHEISVKYTISVKAPTTVISLHERCGKEHRQIAEWLKELKELRLKDARIKDAINNCQMRELAQDEVSSFEHEVLKIYGVME